MQNKTGIERNSAHTAPIAAIATATIRPRPVVLFELVLLALALMVLLSGCPRSDGEGFAIYLLTQETPPARLSLLSHLEIEDAPVISADDLVSYQSDTHEMHLTPEAYSRIMHLGLPLAGRSFAVCVDRKTIYAGAFVIPISSISVDAVVIRQPAHSHDSLDRYVITLELGYPDAGVYTGEDPRAAPEILEALRRDKQLP